MLNISGKFALVTGSTKGIGKAIADRLVQDNVNVIVHGRSKDEVAKVKASINAYGGVFGDLSSSEGCDDVIAQVKAIGEIDILINNAGIFSVEDFFEIDDEQWLKYFQVNVMSTVRVCRAFMPQMLKSDWGRIINVSSEAAIKPLPQMIHYSMTKTSQLALSRGLAELTKGTKVTVNSVLPGPTWTEGVKSYFDGLCIKSGSFPVTLNSLNGFFRNKKTLPFE